jgi:hypothetical protein
MNPNEIVDVEITRNTVVIDTQDFNSVILLTDDQYFAPDRIRTYSELSEILADGATSDSATYKAALPYFQQTPRPLELIVGRRGASILDITLPSSEIVNNKEYDVVLTTSTGTQTFTVTAASDAEDDAADAANDLLVELVDIINAASDADVSAVVEGTETSLTGTLTSTGTAVAGTGTSFTTELSVGNYIEVSNEVLQVATITDDTNLVLAVAPDSDFSGATGVVLSDIVAELTLTNDPIVAGEQDGFAYSWDTAGLEDMATALEAIRADNDKWYAIAYTNHDTSEQEDLAAIIETLDKLYGVSSQTASSLDLVNDANPAASDDIMGKIFEAQYDRTFGIYGATANEDFRETAWLGSKMTAQPGSTNWMFAVLNGQVADGLTKTQADNVLDKNGNTYETVAGSSITRTGTVGSGEYIDVMRGADQLKSNIWSEILRLQITTANAGSKIPLTDAGVAQLIGIVEAEINRMQDSGFIKEFVTYDDGSGKLQEIPAYEIWADPVDSLPSNQRAQRIAPTIYFTAALAGAVNKVLVRGVLNV